MVHLPEEKQSATDFVSPACTASGASLASNGLLSSNILIKEAAIKLKPRAVIINLSTFLDYVVIRGVSLCPLSFTIIEIVLLSFAQLTDAVSV